jgi:hypothetical protein
VAEIVARGFDEKTVRWVQRRVDLNEYKRAQQEAGAFNSQGDSSTFTPGINANSQYARQLANVVKNFWDNLP